MYYVCTTTCTTRRQSDQGSPDSTASMLQLVDSAVDESIPVSQAEPEDNEEIEEDVVAEGNGLG